MARADERTSLLARYRRKRRFDETPEPRGRTGARDGYRFVVQKHAARRLHYDFRLELDGVLKSWAVTRGPSLDPAQKRLAVRTEDHPREYASFEGTIPRGHYGAGKVIIWDRGLWVPMGDPRKGLQDGKLVFELKGERLRGRWVLIRLHGKENEHRENWLLIKENDAEADRTTDVLEVHTTSVNTRRDRRTKRQPAFVEPQLATLVNDLPSRPGWLYEVKFDGYRALVSASGTKVVIWTRNKLDWTAKFPLIAAAVSDLQLDGALLDGEIVAHTAGGRTDFGALQDALKTGRGTLSYFAFDLLALDGHDLRALPLRARKLRLKSLLNGRCEPTILYSEHIEDKGAALLKSLCTEGYEGIMAKLEDAPYKSGRTNTWLKIKCTNEAEFVIIGWSPSARRRFSSLLLGQYQNGSLHYAGRVGTGFDARDLEEIESKLKALRRTSPATDNGIPGGIARNAHWVEPRLVAQVGFANFTREGRIRQGRFLGLRADKPAHSITRETSRPVREVEDVPTRRVRLTHPDKILYVEQGITKRDLARYYDRVAPMMMAFLKDRPVSFVRCPDGPRGQCFFQRHRAKGLPDAFKTFNTDATGKDYVYLDDEGALLAAAQFGILELHLWGARIDKIDCPDRLVFDLDPDQAVDFAAVRHAAFEMHDALDALGLKSFAMLTGGKGIHVIAPLVRRRAWPEVKAFAQGLAAHFAAHAPARYVAAASKVKRKGKIFIDYLRNDRGATAVAPFSPRARAGAPLAWPVEWNALNSFTTANAVTLDQVLGETAEPAIWAGYFDTTQRLTRAALKAVGALG